jgi:hypothetical protein
MNQDEIKSNLLDANQWLRILFMAGFAVAAWLVVIGLIVLVLVQTLIVLVSGETNRNLRKVGYLFGCYLQEIIQYLCYNTNAKPFPFADFPEADERDPGADEYDDDDDEAPITTEMQSPAPFHHRPADGDDLDQPGR